MFVREKFKLWLVRKRRGALEVCTHAYEYRHYLTKLWSLGVPASSTGDSGRTALFSRGPKPPLDWKIAFTVGFSKAITTVDRSLQGRVLLALAELSLNPINSRGDTVKPLHGDKKGLWRYRLGDYRLVYEPLPDHKMVILVDFAARGDVYE